MLSSSGDAGEKGVWTGFDAPGLQYPGREVSQVVKQVLDRKAGGVGKQKRMEMQEVMQ
jgi:hypothetical protein